MNRAERILQIILEAVDLEREKEEFENISANPASARREMKAAKKGREVKVRSIKGTQNTDAPDIKKGWRGLRKAMKLAKTYKEGGLGKKEAKKQRRRVYTQVKSDTDEPSIVRTGGTGKKKQRTLVAGNTRAMVRKALGKKVKVHLYKAPKGAPPGMVRSEKMQKTIRKLETKK